MSKFGSISGVERSVIHSLARNWHSECETVPRNCDDAGSARQAIGVAGILLGHTDIISEGKMSRYFQIAVVKYARR